MAYGDLPLDAPCKPNKGYEGGACNRQSCQAEPARWYNHGSGKWYCKDCRNDIQFDAVNLRDWTYRHLPECGHAMFETREMIDEREARTPPPELDPLTLDGVFGRGTYADTFLYGRPKRPKSASLQRLLGKAKRA